MTGLIYFVWKLKTETNSIKNLKNYFLTPYVTVYGRREGDEDRDSIILNESINGRVVYQNKGNL